MAPPVTLEPQLAAKVLESLVPGLMASSLFRAIGQDLEAKLLEWQDPYNSEELHSGHRRLDEEVPWGVYSLSNQVCV